MKAKYNTFKLIFLSGFLVAWHVTQAQNFESRADKNYHNFNYALAVADYQKSLSRKAGMRMEVLEKIANCYRMMNNTEEAEKWYGQLLYKFPNADPVNILYYAEALRANGDYQEARNQYLKYGKLVPEQKKRAQQFAQNCEKAMEWMANPTQTKIENLKTLNTEYSEFSPLVLQNTLFFTTDRKFNDVDYSDKRIYGWTGMPFLTLAYATADSSSQFTYKNRMRGINTMYHNGPATLSRKGDTIYFTRTNKVKHPKKVAGKEKSNGFINRLEIYSAVMSNGNWGNVMPFPYNDMVNYSVGHPALSPDGNTLYFVSDMPGTLGETDIFFCKKQKDGNWSKPLNAGKAINTEGKELFPYVSPEGTLYFASNGHAGLGGLDLFSAKGKEDNWKKPENLRYPMNTSHDDFALVMDSTGKSGFFSSNREGGSGGDDIYRFSNPTCILAGLTLQVLDNQEKPLEDVLIKLYRKGDTSSVIAFERTQDNQSRKVCLRSYEPCGIVHDAVGKFYFNLQPGLTYELKASKQGYFTQSTTLEAACKTADTINLAMQLKKIELNKPIVLKDLFFNEEDKLFVKKNIYYDLDKADIRYDAALELDKLVDLLRENPNIKIELSAHTDSRHSDDYNLQLSQRRAEAARKYIISKGIAKDVITAKGYGETKLINGCKDGVACSEEEHQQNRRTEIKVTEITEPVTHKVGPYDTLYSIAKMYNTSVDELKKINGLEEDTIYRGNIIKLK